MTVTDESRRPTLQRVPPHDTDTERNLLGAALINPQAAAVVAATDPQIFYMPAHQTIAATIGDLHADGSATDPGTVAAVLRHQGQLDAIGGSTYLVELQAECTATTGTPKWVDLLDGYRQRRRVLSLATALSDAVYKNTPTDGLVAELHDATNARHRERLSTWEPANLAHALAGEGDDLEPFLLARTDNVLTLYPGKVHSLVGEPESGKSWMGLLACVQAITAGHHVLYVDFEADATTQVTRLLELGLDPQQILEQFHYVRPDEPHDKAAAFRLAAVLDGWPITLAILDGVAEALSLNGWDENKAGDVTAFYVRVARPLTRNGAAVVTIDHVVKDKESQGRYARGSTAKLAAIDGAVYKLDVYRPFGRGLAGAAKVIVSKDRHGHVRSVAAGGKVLGELHLDSTAGVLLLEFKPPTTTDSGGGFRPTGYMERVSRELEGAAEMVSANTICTLIGGKKATVLLAIKTLIAEGFVDTKAAARGFLHYSVKPYREAYEKDYPDDQRDGDHG